MTEDAVPFASPAYWLLLGLLVLARGADVGSTWVATPRLVLEANPIARKLGWRWGMPLNLGLCLGFAFWPLPAIIISTTSMLVAARNFQSAWLMRSLGEQAYRAWHVRRLLETPVSLFLGCLLAQCGLIAAVGGAVVLFSGTPAALVPLGIGLGIVAYAAAILIFTLLGLWRLRRALGRSEPSRDSWGCCGPDEV